MPNPFSLWVYLSTTPLVWLTATLFAWVAADALARASGRHPLVNPVLIAIAIVATLLLGPGRSTGPISKAPSSCTSCSGRPRSRLRCRWRRTGPSCAGTSCPWQPLWRSASITAIVSAVGIAKFFGVPSSVLVALAPKSVTAGVAMAISDQLGGEPALTAVLVITTGIIGAVLVTPVMNALRIRDYAARGFAVGLASHGIGTARAFSVDPVAGTFAGIAMGLNAVATALAVPPLMKLLG